MPVTNLDAVKPGELKLTGAVLADIFLGKIKNWNDKAITDLNPGFKLDGPITVVRRSDGSGTTFVFVDHLSKASPEWKSKVGVGTASPGQRAWAARTTKAWRSMYNESGRDWFTLNTPTPRRTSLTASS